MSYVKNAPNELRRQHADFKLKSERAPAASQAARSFKILSALTEHPNMVKVWAALSARAARKGDGWQWRFAKSVIAADVPLKAWEDAAPAKRRNSLKSISKHARKAAVAMKAFRDYEYFSALRLVAPFGSALEEGIVRLTGKDPTLLSVDAWLTHELDIRLSEVLSRVADECDALSNAAPLVHGNKASNPALLAFVRRLHVVMQEHFGAPLHEVVSEIANALYSPNDSLDAERVRHICKTKPGSWAVK